MNARHELIPLHFLVFLRDSLYLIDYLVGRDMRPIDILRCKLSFFGASKYDPKSDLWTRITLFQGAPLPHQLQEENSCDWLFPYLSDA